MATQRLSCPYCGEAWAEEEEVQESSVLNEDNHEVVADNEPIQRVCASCLSIHLLM